MSNIAADRARAMPPEKPACSRNEATALIENAEARGLLTCVDYGGTKGTLCALPEVYDAWCRKEGKPADKGDAGGGL